MNLYLQGRPASTPSRINSSRPQIFSHRSAHFSPNICITRTPLKHAYKLSVNCQTPSSASTAAPPNSPLATSLDDIVYASSVTDEADSARGVTNIVVAPFAEPIFVRSASATPRAPVGKPKPPNKGPKRPHSAHTFHSPSSPHFSYPRLLRERHLSRQQLVTGKSSVIQKGSVDALATSKATVKKERERQRERE